jgi:hypothetical protein
MVVVRRATGDPASGCFGHAFKTGEKIGNNHWEPPWVKDCFLPKRKKSNGSMCRGVPEFGMVSEVRKKAAGPDPVKTIESTSFSRTRCMNRMA